MSKFTRFMSSVTSRNVIVSLLALLLATSGCDGEFLSFGEKVQKSGSAIGQAELTEIESLTSIQLPPGTTGFEYFYNGSGIDDYLAAKLQIDPAEVLSAEDIVNKLSNDPAPVPTGWADWLSIKPNDVVLNRKGEWSQFNYGEAALTYENGIYYLYIVWFTM